MIASEETNTKLNELIQRCTSQKYISHYTVERECKKIIKNCNLNSVTKKLINTLEVEIEKLENSNMELIKNIDFRETCLALINAGDVANLKGIIDIGHYFGVGVYKLEISSQLDLLLDVFKLSMSKRTPVNQPCLDYLCDLLKEPRLVLPKTQFSQYTNSREKIINIVESDAINDLMVWMIDASQTDLDFALRIASSKTESLQCLLFLLGRTAPSESHVPRIHLISPGNLSGNIAMHVVINSGNFTNIQLFLNEKTTPNDDLLKQLLVLNNKQLTPLDLIKNIKNEKTRSKVINYIRGAVNQHGKKIRYGLTEQNIQLLHELLDNAAQTIAAVNPDAPGILKKYLITMNPLISRTPIIDNKLVAINAITTDYLQITLIADRLVSELAPTQDNFLLMQTYQSTKAAIKDHIANITQHNQHYTRKQILACIKADNVANLRQLTLSEEESAYALRVSACGAIECLKFLVTQSLAGLTISGGTSGKIPLHFAINRKQFEEKHLECIETLLNAADQNHPSTPIQQLLFPNKDRKRPIDKLKCISAKSARQILKIIDNAVEASGTTVDKKDQSDYEIMRKEIAKKISPQINRSDVITRNSLS